MGIRTRELVVLPILELVLHHRRIVRDRFPSFSKVQSDLACAIWFWTCHKTICLVKGGSSIFGLRATKKAGKPDYTEKNWIFRWIKKGSKNSSAKRRKKIFLKKFSKIRVKVRVTRDQKISKTGFCFLFQMLFIYSLDP